MPTHRSNCRVALATSRPRALQCSRSGACSTRSSSGKSSQLPSLHGSRPIRSRLCQESRWRCSAPNQITEWPAALLIAEAAFRVT